jgi:membrane-associated protease RseP (regulator of RpoE activity)
VVVLEEPSESVEKKEESMKRIEFHFPLILLKTRAGIQLMTRIGQLKSVKGFAWLSMVMFPLLAVAGIYLIVNSLLVFLSIPAAGEAAREAGLLANILIPGLNPYLPIVFGWMGLVVAIVVHEGGHGVIARSLNLPVKSAGMVFLLFVPIGAFVEPDEAALKKAKLKDALRMLAAGVGNNILTAIIFLLLVMMLVSSLAPATPIHGLGVVGVYEDYPAYNAGLRPADILVSINNCPLNEVQDFSEVMDDLKPLDPVNITYARHDSIEHRTVLLAENPANASESFLGLQVVSDPALILENYEELSGSFSALVYLITPTFLSGPYFVPYSDVLHVFYTSPIGGWFHPLSNLFYWIWFINFNVALFNALPMIPLDGGYVFSRIIKRLGGEKMKESTADNITYIVSFAMIFMVILMVALPYL